MNLRELKVNHVLNFKGFLSDSAGGVFQSEIVLKTTAEVFVSSDVLALCSSQLEN